MIIHTYSTINKLFKEKNQESYKNFKYLLLDFHESSTVFRVMNMV